jgi:hypothetical protein
VSQSTAPVLLIGGITLANRSVLHDEPVDWRIPIATAILAGFASLAERAAPKPVTMLAWLALITVLIARVDPKVPAPMESLNAWLKKGRLA